MDREATPTHRLVPAIVVRSLRSCPEIALALSPQTKQHHPISGRGGGRWERIYYSIPVAVAGHLSLIYTFVRGGVFRRPEATRRNCPEPSRWFCGSFDCSLGAGTGIRFGLMVAQRCLCFRAHTGLISIECPRGISHERSAAAVACATEYDTTLLMSIERGTRYNSATIRVRPSLTSEGTVTFRRNLSPCSRAWASK